MLVAQILVTSIATSTAASTSSVADYLAASARGAVLLAEERFAEAADELRRARLLTPSSPTVARDLAVALVALERFEEALDVLEDVEGLGDVDPEVLDLLAVVLVRLGQDEAAREVASSSGTFDGDALAFALGDRSRLDEVASRLGDRSLRAIAAARLLEAHAAKNGDGARARALSGLAQAGERSLLAASSGAWPIEPIGVGAIARATVDVSTNPRLVDRSTLSDTGARATVEAEAGIAALIGRARVDGAFAFEQQKWLVASEADDFEVSAFTLCLGIEVPLEASPLTPSAGLGLRLLDVSGALLSTHHAFAIDGGPRLRLPISSNLEVLLELLAIATDFVDGSPRDTRASSQNRDFIGQRVMASIRARDELVSGNVELSFLRDDARGSAFDAVGGSIAGLVEVTLTDVFSLDVAAGLDLRRYGPVGDPRVLGAASTREELRLSVGAGLRAKLTGALSLTVMDSYVQKVARGTRGYSDNLTRLGAEVSF
ncbi:MAG: tetratricopeptide repeat protein [Deltaproteobacteria bacterium]|nr:tetratricopeptide repeat protein [Deltaproteobacteria bacterium]